MSQSNTLQVISATGFYGSIDPTNSVKALYENTRKNQVKTRNYNKHTPVKKCTHNNTENLNPRSYVHL